MVSVRVTVELLFPAAGVSTDLLHRAQHHRKPVQRRLPGRLRSQGQSFTLKISRLSQGQSCGCAVGRILLCKYVTQDPTFISYIVCLTRVLRQECHVLTLSSGGTVTDHLVLHPLLDTGNFIIKVVWLPGACACHATGAHAAMFVCLV